MNNSNNLPAKTQTMKMNVLFIENVYITNIEPIETINSVFAKYGNIEKIESYQQKNKHFILVYIYFAQLTSVGEELFTQIARDKFVNVFYNNSDYNYDYWKVEPVSYPSDRVLVKMI